MSAVIWVLEHLGIVLAAVFSVALLGALAAALIAPEQEEESDRG